MPELGAERDAGNQQLSGGGDWRDCLVLGGDVGNQDVPQWLTHAMADFRNSLSTSTYPCFFGTQALRANAIHYTFVAGRDLGGLAATLRHFLKRRNHPLANLAVFFEPIPEETHAQARERFWHVLRYLEEADPCERCADDPDDPYWEFTFAGVQMFVVGISPTYRVRRSRNLGQCMVILFQPRDVFDMSDSGPDAGRRARALIRARVRAWDGIEHHPFLGTYGDPDNREWAQYFLPDDNEQSAGTCPLRRALATTGEIDP